MSKKQKKTFVFTTERIGNKGDRRSHIYRIKRNRPINVGVVEWRTGSTPGSESEVLRYLVAKKELPKYLLKVSECNWRGAGYYCPEIEDLGYYIKEL